MQRQMLLPPSNQSLTELLEMLVLGLESTTSIAYGLSTSTAGIPYPSNANRHASLFMVGHRTQLSATSTIQTKVLR